MLYPRQVRLRSFGHSDVGRRREINEDAFVERAEIGIWAVADGLGGHRDGEVASRMVCDALAELVWRGADAANVVDPDGNVRGRVSVSDIIAAGYPG